MLKQAMSKLQKNAGVSFRLGLFFIAMGLLATSIAINGAWVAKFRTTAIRFVPAEAVSFVVVPDLESFMTYGSSSFLAIASDLESDQSDPDFISLLMPRPKLKEQEFPAQCRTLRDLSDLQNSGFEPQSSFSIARLDSGARVAVKIRDDAKALAFLSDVLFPAYIRIGAADEKTQPDKDTAKQPTSPSSSDVEEIPELARTFSLSVAAENVELCLDADRRHPLTGSVEKKFDSTIDHFYVPLRAADTQNEPGAVPSLDIRCSVSIGNKQTPCACEVVQLGLGENSEDNILTQSCSADLGSRIEKARVWRSEISAGKTVTIGNHYVAKIDDFLVVEQLTAPRAPRNFKIVEPRSSLVRDDSFLRNFQEMLSEGEQYSSTLLAGARPDWIVEYGGSGLRGFPMYLITPISMHFRKDEVYLTAATNLEPQDMAIIQTLTARESFDTSTNKWNNWPNGIGAKLADSSLKMYARFLRLYFPSADQDISRYAELGPVAIDIMEEGTSTLVGSMSDVSNDGKSARLALEIPNIDSDYAGRLVTRARRQSILRQARLTVETAARMALQRGVSPKSLFEAVSQLTCTTKYWRLRSLVARDLNPDDDSFSSTKFRSDIEIDDDALLKEQSWSTSQDGIRLQRLLPFEDANADLWGGAYSGAKGFVQVSQELIGKDVADFEDALSDLQKESLDDTEKFQKTLKSRAVTLLAMVHSLEKRRSAIKGLDLGGLINEALQKTKPNEAIDALGALLSIANDGGLEESAKINSEDIGAFCSTQQKKQMSSPVATYDANQRALYIVESPEQAKSLPSAAAEADMAGKLLATFTMPNLATLLKKGGANYTDIERAQNFPFDRIRLSVSGRDSGAGAELRLSMKRTNGEP